MIEFSIIVPVYNAAETLERCIESVISQTYPNFEVLLVDDGSTDKSRQICHEYSGRDGRIKVSSHSNRGALLSRCEGIKRAEGEYCVFMDADDWLERNALEIIHRLVLENECDVLLYNYRCIAETKQWVADPVFPNGFTFTGENKMMLYAEFLQRDSINSMWTKAIKRQLLQANADFSYLPHRVTMGEDVLQSMLIYRSFNKLVYTSEPIYNYYVNESGITRSAKAEIYYLDCNLVFKAKLNMAREVGLGYEAFLSLISNHYMRTISQYLLIMRRSRLSFVREIRVYKDMRNASIFAEMLRLFQGCKLDTVAEGYTWKQKISLRLLILRRFSALYILLRIPERVLRKLITGICG